MATTDAQICNRALARIGSTKFIDSLSEQTEEARVCKEIYGQTRDAVLAVHPWPFATRRAPLAELATVTRSGWAHAFALPADCLVARELWSGVRRPRPDDRIPFSLEDNGTARILLTNANPPAELIYTAQITEAILLPALVVDALAWSLAGDLALALAVKDRFEVQARARYEIAIQRAMVQAINEETHEGDPPPVSVAIRGAGGFR